MTGPTFVVRFAGDVDPGIRTEFTAALSRTGLPISTGWDLGHRGPGGGTVWIAALVDLLADVTEIGATAAAELGRTASGFLREISSPGDPVCVEFSDRPGQRIWRLRATDTPLAYWKLARGGTPPADTPVMWNGMNWSEDPSREPHPTVFVCYAHDSPQHQVAVLAFCEMLTAGGVEPRFDRWFLGDRRDWQLWMTRQITESDYIIVIASERCRLVGDGKNEPDTNLGLQAEMRLLRELYQADNEQWTKRILPVVLPGHKVDEIPLFLQPHSADHFAFSEITTAAAGDLLRILHSKPVF
ncbi:MAG TPA: SEFIR domain-containing protein [Acidobacteriaceae bacterium]|nr:SEFIR domain-containing protein [Acidobacteriaceae bacterium]